MGEAGLEGGREWDRVVVPMVLYRSLIADGGGGDWTSDRNAVISSAVGDT